MWWLLFAFLCALFDSFRDVVVKVGLQLNEMNTFVVVWGFTFFGALFFSPFLLYFGFPEVSSSFWWALLIGASINVFALSSFFRALKIADLSLAAPLAAVTPVFLLITSPLMSGFYGNLGHTSEVPGPVGVIGVALIAIGIYVLNMSSVLTLNRQQGQEDRQIGFFEPIKSIYTNKGSRLVFIAAFCWSFTITFDKIGMGSIEGASHFHTVTFWGFSILLAISLCTLPVMYFARKRDRRRALSPAERVSVPSAVGQPMRLQAGKLTTPLAILVGLGLIDVLITITHMLAISLTVAAYGIAVKRTAIIFKVIWGWLIFKESGIQSRLFGATLMVFGVILLSNAELVTYSDMVNYFHFVTAFVNPFQLDAA